MSDRKSLTESKIIKSSQVIKLATIIATLIGILGNQSPVLIIISLFLTVIILVASGIIDLERVKKWNKGDRWYFGFLEINVFIK